MRPATRTPIGSAASSSAVRLAELLGDLLRRVRVIEPVGIRRVAQGLDFAQLFAALLVLVERLKFQRNVPFK